MLRSRDNFYIRVTDATPALHKKYFMRISSYFLVHAFKMLLFDAENLSVFSMPATVLWFENSLLTINDAVLLQGLGTK